MNKFNGRFLEFLGLGECLVTGDGAQALVPLNLDGEQIGIRFSQTTLPRLISALVELQSGLERQSGQTSGLRETPVIRVQSAKATTPIGTDGVALLLAGDSMPFAFGMTREQAFALAKELLQAHERAKRNASRKAN